MREKKKKSPQSQPCFLQKIQFSANSWLPNLSAMITLKPKLSVFRCFCVKMSRLFLEVDGQEIAWRVKKFLPDFRKGHESLEGKFREFYFQPWLSSSLSFCMFVLWSILDWDFSSPFFAIEVEQQTRVWWPPSVQQKTAVDTTLGTNKIDQKNEHFQASYS